MEHYVGRNIPANWWESTNIMTYDSEFDQDDKPSVAAAFIDFTAFDSLAPRTQPKLIADYEPQKDYFNTINPPESDAK